MTEQMLNACFPAADPNWWALVSIGCGIFLLGMAVGGLIGAAIANEANRPLIIHPEADEQ